MESRHFQSRARPIYQASETISCHLQNKQPIFDKNNVKTATSTAILLQYAGYIIQHICILQSLHLRRCNLIHGSPVRILTTLLLRISPEKIATLKYHCPYFLERNIFIFSSVFKIWSLYMWECNISWAAHLQFWDVFFCYKYHIVI